MGQTFGLNFRPTFLNTTFISDCIYRSRVMGIHGLTQLLSEAAPSARRETQLKDHFGRKIAIDASMCLYQFLIAIRTGPSAESGGGLLANDAGEVTRHVISGLTVLCLLSDLCFVSQSHLIGMFYRTARLMENGLKPCYVFDGKPPHMKSSEVGVFGMNICAFLPRVVLPSLCVAGEAQGTSS
jgi:hypothetical protein